MHKISIDDEPPASSSLSSKKQMVRITLAAALLMPLAEAAYGQLAVNCTQKLVFDTIAVCGAGGTLQVQPDGDVVSTACVIPIGGPQEGICKIAKITSTTGSLQLKMTATTTNISGPAAMKVQNFNLNTDAGGTTITFSSAALTKTFMTIGVGADLVANGGQLIGSYSGQLLLQAIFTP